MKAHRKNYIRRTAVKTKPRKASEFARIYGSKQRVIFVKSLPCSACGVTGFSENAHVLGNGGMGRKGDYTGIAPLCGVHSHPTDPRGTLIGCHAFFDEFRAEFDACFPGFNPQEASADTEMTWVEYSKQENGK